MRHLNYKPSSFNAGYTEALARERANRQAGGSAFLGVFGGGREGLEKFQGYRQLGESTSAAGQRYMAGYTSNEAGDYYSAMKQGLAEEYPGGMAQSVAPGTNTGGGQPAIDPLGFYSQAVPKGGSTTPPVTPSFSGPASMAVSSKGRRKPNRVSVEPKRGWSLW